MAGLYLWSKPSARMGYKQQGVRLLNYPIDKIILFFIIYAFLGWCLEVIVSTIQTGKFVNRGFLNGPFCPVYGFGVIAVLALVAPFKDSFMVIFVGSIILTTIVEFITGYILEKSFNQKWWDYSKEPLNIRGYVCAQTSLLWGVACVFLIYVLQPPLGHLVGYIPVKASIFITAILVFIMVVDTIITIIALAKLKRKIYLAQDIGDRIKSLSDIMGKTIHENTMAAMKVGDNNLKELETLKNKYQAILNEKTFKYNRILRAFPTLKLAKPKIRNRFNKIK